MKPSLTFADPPTLASRLEKGHKAGPGQWMARCPCHADNNPSLSIRWGRNGATLVKCHAGCAQRGLLAELRRLGFTLKPEPPGPRTSKRPVTVADSAALRACNVTERRMLSLILAGESPSYDRFEAEGARRTAIPGGLRALEAVGLIEAKRKPRQKGCLRYDRNQYGASDQWRRWEPGSRSTAARKEAAAQTRAVAAAARKAKGSNLNSSVTPGKAEAESPGLRLPEVSPIAASEVSLRHLSEVSLSEVPPRGVDSYPALVREGESGANESRTESPEGSNQGRRARKDASAATPRRHGDPGPSCAAVRTSAAGYGFEVAPLDPVPELAPLAELCSYACGKAGECVEPGGVCVQRRAAALARARPEPRRFGSARGRTSEWR
jgi:hypothetical protein